MLHFIRLTRPLNLIIIGITMYGLGWYFEDMFTNFEEFGIRSKNFFLLVISTLLIAAAGNIINDYFDVKADRINKPEKLIIGKHVKRRVAIITHWGLNFVAFAIAVYLSWKFNTFWYLFIHLLSINVLWVYSSYFKRRFLIGNIMIAALTAMVPLLVGFYFFHHPHLELRGDYQVNFMYPFFGSYGLSYIAFLSMGLAFFAFILNLAREIVKDIEDVKGDQLIKSKSLPIVLGIRSSKLVSYFILTGALIGVSLVITTFPIMTFEAIYPLMLAAFFNLAAIALLIQADSKKGYNRVNSCIKIAMVAGTLSPIYWKILLNYV